MGFPVVIITDCQDDNAKMRQISRVVSLMPGVGSVAFCGVNSTIEASGNIVDALDAFDGSPGLILANVAPRSGESRMWENGSPFGYLNIKKSLVLGTIDGYTFSVLQKIVGRNLQVKVFDITEAVRFLGLNTKTAKRVINTQFRSFEFMPRAASAILKGIKIPAHSLSGGAPLCPNAVWWVDNFGNLKTTILPKEVGFKPGKELLIIRMCQGPQEITCFERLSHVPDGKFGLIIGSSGCGSRRFLEIVLQGGSASSKLGLCSGSEIVFSEK